jgi:hypothetical protein
VESVCALLNKFPNRVPVKGLFLLNATLTVRSYSVSRITLRTQLIAFEKYILNSVLRSTSEKNAPAKFSKSTWSHNSDFVDVVCDFRPHFDGKLPNTCMVYAATRSIFWKLHGSIAYQYL